MFRNFRMVSNVIYGRGSFDQLGDILAPRRKTSDSFMVFLVDDVFMEAALKDRVPVETPICFCGSMWMKSLPRPMWMS